MNKKKTAIIRMMAIMIICCLGLFFGKTTTVQAANTVFMVPNFTEQNLPDTMFYSNYKNIQMYQGGYGIVTDMDNISGIGAGIAEIGKHVNERSATHFSIDIYTNGSDFSASDMNAIVDDGWGRVEAYYYDYEISVNPVSTTENFAPRIWNRTDSIATQVLRKVNYSSPVAIVGISGVNQPFFGAIYYQPDYAFLGYSTLYCYKFMPKVGYFVPSGEAYYNSYDSGFLDLYGIDDVDQSVNGTYVITTTELPAEIVATASDWMNMTPLIELTQEPGEVTGENSDDAGNSAGSSDESESDDAEDGDADNGVVNEDVESTDNQDMEIITANSISEKDIQALIDQNKALCMQNDEKTIEWKFRVLDTAEDFIASATIERVDDKDICIDFAHEGDLPGDAEVTISLEKFENQYENGTTLYLYYMNPQTNQNELSSTGVFEQGKVTFSMTHCSKYVITSENRGKVYEDADDNFSVKYLVGGGIGLLAIVIVTALIIVFVKKKRAVK